MISCTGSISRRDEPARHRFRSIFISDIHLGSRGCKVGPLLDFLRRVESDHLYLVGDIVDGWRLERRRFWPAAHAEILDRLLARAFCGTRVVYLPGNHDEALRALDGDRIGEIRVAHDLIHTCADGRRLLVVHGDHFDLVTMEMRWLARAGAWAYELSIPLDGIVDALRSAFGRGRWSLSAWLKAGVKAALDVAADFERRLVAEARRRAVCGVVCGHVHKPKMCIMDGVLYVNDGDWVESCTALVEHFDGTLELLRWPDGHSVVLPPRARPRAAGHAPAVAA
jgi:UDP-2,3-diacylglucosamine pyrophosphatase LpxH